MIQIRRITMSDPLYPQECTLREQVLLGPIGLDMAKYRAEFPGMEEKFEHFIAVFNHPTGPRVVGCAALLIDPSRPGVGRLSQMAIDPQRQGEGIGKRLVVAVEQRAFGEKQLGELYCHAQIPACGFYRKLGWTTEGDVFTEAGIDHRKMVLRPPTEDDGAE